MVIWYKNIFKTEIKMVKYLKSAFISRFSLWGLRVEVHVHIRVFTYRRINNLGVCLCNSLAHIYTICEGVSLSEEVLLEILFSCFGLLSMTAHSRWSIYPMIHHKQIELWGIKSTSGNFRSYQIQIAFTPFNQ